MKLYYILDKPVGSEKGSEEFETAARNLKKLKRKHDVLNEALSYVKQRHRSSRPRIILNLNQLFSKNLEEVSRRRGFMHCTNQNALLASLLLKSGLFGPEDIKAKWTINFVLTPHNYLMARTENGWLEVDPWSYDYGLPVGDHAHGLHIGSLFRKP
jgi:hypothetical protein